MDYKKEFVVGTRWQYSDHPHVINVKEALSDREFKIESNGQELFIRISFDVAILSVVFLGRVFRDSPFPLYLLTPVD